MIIITGATGKLGSAIVERLLEKLPAEQIGVSVRDPQKAQALTERGVRVRRGDFADATGLRHAFEGASQILIVSVDVLGEAGVNLHRNAIEAARTAGAERVLYTSHMAANPASLVPFARDHAATEEILKTSGIAFTSLRNGFHADAGIRLMGNALETGRLAAPADGPVCWTAHADLAQAAAIALTKEGRLDGITPPLTAPQTVDLAGLAAIASELTGRPVIRIPVPDAEHRTALISHGTPEMFADMSLSFFAASRQGEFSATDPTLERLLGRPPMSMRDVLAAALSS